MIHAGGTWMRATSPFEVFEQGEALFAMPAMTRGIPEDCLILEFPGAAPPYQHMSNRESAYRLPCYAKS